MLPQDKGGVVDASLKARPFFPAPQSEAPMADVVAVALGVRHEEHPRCGPLDAPAHDRRAHAEYVPRSTSHVLSASRISYLYLARNVMLTTGLLLGTVYVIAEQGTCVLSKVFVRLLASRSCLTGTALGLGLCFSCGYHQEELRVLIRLLLRRYTEKYEKTRNGNERRSMTTKILVYAAKDGCVVFVSRTVLTYWENAIRYSCDHWATGTNRMTTTLLQDLFQQVA